MTKSWLGIMGCHTPNSETIAQKKCPGVQTGHTTLKVNIPFHNVNVQMKIPNSRNSTANNS